MIKTIVVARRKEGMSLKDFNDYWEHKHGPLAAKLIPGVRRYVQNHLIEVPGMEYDGDGVVEMWYDDIESWQKSLKVVRASKELAADAMNFCAMGKRGQEYVVEEHVIVGKK